METFGMLAEWSMIGGWLLFALAAVTLGFVGASLIVWTVIVGALFWLLGAPLVLWLLVGIPLLVMNLVPLRRHLVSRLVMSTMEKLKLVPVISETERVALEAGTTWVDAELFSGKPDFDRLRTESYSDLTPEEQKFIDGPVAEVCRMVTDWEIYQHKDLPPNVWSFLKDQGFFGMIVPKEFGGLGFSARAQSEVVARLAAHSTTLCVTVMVPNSLGPAELLAHYGTQAQKEHYLPRLASGAEIPCFALTEPNAGSDAGSMTSSGLVFKDVDGQIKVRLNWNKRYITLAAVSSLIGLAVKLRDPDNLLGQGEAPGITCVLVPANTPGVALGRRHNPMGVPFYNCPTEGTDVVVSVDQIVGGAAYAGRGWTMLMECLAAGRAISLPSQATGGVKHVAALTSAYSTVRRQFGVAIGKFEGIEEPLARITGLAYLMEAARIYTVGAVDSGKKPSVVSAIAKYNQTELARKAVNDGMDILGGAAISRGPRNMIANAYTGMPISITVEGANILTRCLIVFGQGAIRCHPYAYQEVKALQDGDLKSFDKAFWGHIGHVVRNSCRSLLLSLTRGRLARAPSGPAKRYYRKLAWASASFAIMSDVAMGTLGGSLKMKEKLTGRYADVLSWMYFATAILRRYEAEGYREDHKDVFEWSMQYAFARIQEAFDGIFSNFETPAIGWIFRGPFAMWSRFNSMGRDPADRLGHKIARAIQQPGAFRDSIIAGSPLSAKSGDFGDQLNDAFILTHQAAPITANISKAVRSKKLPKKRPAALVKEAVASGIITAAEAELVIKAEKARDNAIQVDSFDLEDFEPTQLDVALKAVGQSTSSSRDETAGAEIVAMPNASKAQG